MTLRPATKGWIGLAIYVTAWDILAPETLSRGFYEATRHPVKRWPLTLAWAFITAHLFRLLPERYDVLRHLSRRVK